MKLYGYCDIEQNSLLASHDAIGSADVTHSVESLSPEKKEDHHFVFSYDESHDQDVRMSLKRLQNKAIVAPDPNTPLPTLLFSRGKEFHLPNASLPRELRRKRIARNTDVVVGRHGGRLCRELGRGAYGVVLLMDVPENGLSKKVAVKVQSPTDSLAWEYEVLQRLVNRIRRSGNAYASNVYPQPFSFISLADGGIFSMSAASSSGLNLLDLSNFYKLKLGEAVPELLVLHFTSQMLRIVTDLYWHGEILVSFYWAGYQRHRFRFSHVDFCLSFYQHCDIKPDNFALSASENPDFSDIEFAGLTLVDFGRAIDLVQLAAEVGEAHNVMLVGASAEGEMRCVAMRNHKPWSFDADTFGVLASIHVLLHGTHIKIVKGKNNKWRPSTTLKRYWQQGIWDEIFDSLLNFEEASGKVMRSRASYLRALSRKIDDYLNTEKKSLRSMLSRQAHILPDSREKI